MAFTQGQISVGTAPTPICSPGVPGNGIIQAMGTVPVAIGGPNVAAVGASCGVFLPLGASATAAGNPVPFPVVHYGGYDNSDDRLYGVVAAGSANVNYLLPS